MQMHWRSLPIVKMHGGSLRDKRREEASAGILEKIEHKLEAVLQRAVGVAWVAHYCRRAVFLGGLAAVDARKRGAVGLADAVVDGLALPHLEYVP